MKLLYVFVAILAATVAKEIRSRETPTGILKAEAPVELKSKNVEEPVRQSRGSQKFKNQPQSRYYYPQNNYETTQASYVPTQSNYWTTQSPVPPQNNYWTTQSSVSPQNNYWTTQSPVPPQNNYWSTQSPVPPQNNYWSTQTPVPPQNNYWSTQSPIPQNNYWTTQRPTYVSTPAPIYTYPTQQTQSSWTQNPWNQNKVPSGSTTQTNVITNEYYTGDNGSYKYEYKLTDGTNVGEEGYVINPNTDQASAVKKGWYSYVAADGYTHLVTYWADHTGYHANYRRYLA